LGFKEVYDYRPGKADWFAAGLPREGAEAGVERAGDVAEEVSTCRSHERVGDVIDRIAGEICAVTTEDGCLIGLLKLDKQTDRNAVVGDVMSDGPGTWRPNVAAKELRDYLKKKGRSQVFITTSDGRLIGLVKADG
jgi:hypothetical protein